MVRVLDTLSLLTGSVIISGNEEAYLSLVQLPGGAAYHQVQVGRTSPEVNATALRSYVAETHQPMPGGVASSADSWALPRPPMSTSRNAWALPPSPGNGPAVSLTGSVAEDPHVAHSEEVAALREENALLNQEEAWRAAEGLQLRKEAAELRRGGELLLRQNELLRRNYTQLWLQHQQAARRPESAATIDQMLTYEVPLHAGPSKNKALLAVLEAVGLGIFGIDRCYMGDTCRGILKGVTFGGFLGWAVLDYFVVLVNTIEKADHLDVLGFNATFRKKAFREDSSSTATTATTSTTTEIDVAYYIMVLSYGAFFAGEFFMCVHWKLSPSERGFARHAHQPRDGQQQGYAHQGSGPHDVNQHLTADRNAQAAGSSWGWKRF